MVIFHSDHSKLLLVSNFKLLPDSCKKLRWNSEVSRTRAFRKASRNYKKSADKPHCVQPDTHPTCYPAPTILAKEPRNNHGAANALACRNLWFKELDQSRIQTTISSKMSHILQIHLISFYLIDFLACNTELQNFAEEQKPKRQFVAVFVFQTLRKLKSDKDNKDHFFTL